MSHPSSRTRQGYLYVAKYFSPSHFERRWCVLEGTQLRILEDVGKEQCFSVIVSQASVEIFKKNNNNNNNNNKNTILISPKANSSTSIYLKTSSISERIAWHAALRHIALTPRDSSWRPPEHLQQLYHNIYQRLCDSEHPALTAFQCLIQWYNEVEDRLEHEKYLKTQISECESNCTPIRDLAIALHHKLIELALARIKFITGLATHISQNLSSVPFLSQKDDNLDPSAEFRASFESAFQKERGSKYITEVKQLRQELYQEMDRNQSWWNEKGQALVLSLLDAEQHEHRRKRIIFRKYRKRRQSKTEQQDKNDDKSESQNQTNTNSLVHEDTQALYDLISVWEKLEQASEHCVFHVRQRIASSHKPLCPLLLAFNPHKNTSLFIQKIIRILASSDTLRNLDHLTIDCEQLLQRLSLRVCHHLTSLLEKHGKTHQEQALIAQNLGPAATSPLTNTSLLSVHRAIATRSHLLLAARRAALAQTYSEKLRAWIDCLQKYESVKLIAEHVLQYGSVRRITGAITSSIKSLSIMQRLENDAKKGETQAELSHKFVDNIARAHNGDTRALKDVGTYYAELAQLSDPPFPYLNSFLSFIRNLAVLVHLDRITVEDALFTDTNLRSVCLQHCGCSKQDEEFIKICENNCNQEQKIVDENLLEMDTSKAQEKLKELLALASPTRIAINMIKLGEILVEASPTNGPVPADILLPGVILTIFRTQPSNICSVLAFVRRFGNIHGKCEYFLTCFESAVEFIKDISNDETKLD